MPEADEDPSTASAAQMPALIEFATGSGWHFLSVGPKVVAKFGFTDKFRRVLMLHQRERNFTRSAAVGRVSSTSS